MSRVSLAIIAAVSTVALSQIASAADLPRKAPASAPPPPAVHSWTGCYLGGNVGGGWQRNHFVDPITGINAGSDTGTGVVGGAQIGCDYQSANWVFGIQGMFDWTNADNSHQWPGFEADTLGTKAKWFATLTGRIGYAVQPQALIYLKGGAAWLHNDYSDSCPATVACTNNLGGIGYFGSADTTRTGWTIGGGFEYAFVRNWSVFVEYAYMDFGSRNETLTYHNAAGGALNPATFNIKHTFQTALVGVNYRFNGWR